MTKATDKMEEAAAAGVLVEEADVETLLLAAAEKLEHRRGGRVKSFRLRAADIRALAARIKELEG